MKPVDHFVKIALMYKGIIKYDPKYDKLIKDYRPIIEDKTIQALSEILEDIK